MTTAGACRSCGSGGLKVLLELGHMPLANRLLRKEDLERDEPVYPLTLAFCTRCSLVQILETIPPETLFLDYPYFSSYSDTMVEHARWLSERLIRSRGLDASNLVVELASNDGYLLQHFVRSGIPVLGVEPAQNVARVARDERGVPTLTEFFGAPLARGLRHSGTTADLILAINVLAHVPDLNGFVEGIRILLRPGGVTVIEVPYVGALVERNEFDTIYHEHLCYFSLGSLVPLFGRHGLVVSDVEPSPMHGGSLLVSLGHEGSVERGQRVSEWLQRESDDRVDRVDLYASFGREVERLRCELRQLLAQLRSGGRRLAAYGAAAKGTVLLNYCGIGRETLDFVVDRSPHKQGRFIPGVQLPIYPPARLLEKRPDYALLLAWNFAEEIMEQQGEYLRSGGRFVLPIPEPRVL